MSKKVENEVIEINPEEEISGGQTDEEVVEEKKPNKVLNVLKKIAPFAMIGGAIAAAFAFGRSSGADVAYMEMLGDGSSEDGDTASDQDDSDDGTNDQDNSENE